VEIGKKIFHPISISWSYRYRGKVARTRTKAKQKIKAFNATIVADGKNANSPQPPRKSSDLIIDIKIMFPYSARKNMAKIIEEYSTLYPATSSASASGRSKGVLFVSAIMEIKKIIESGKSGRKNITVSVCAVTISVKLRDPPIKITGIIIKLIETS
jgi:hypothetical protein